MINRDDRRLGVCAREQLRRAALTDDQAEAEDYALACQMAAIRDDPRPDREQHRAAWNARRGIDAPADGEARP